MVRCIPSYVSVEVQFLFTLKSVKNRSVIEKTQIREKREFSYVTFRFVRHLVLPVTFTQSIFTP